MGVTYAKIVWKVSSLRIERRLSAKAISLILISIENYKSQSFNKILANQR